MTIVQISYFLETAKLLNFTKAADTLNITQQALSYSIRGLEKELELKLFHRTTRNIELTKAGEILFSEWSKILYMVENSIKQARAANGEDGNKIRIGVMEIPGLFSFAEQLMEQLMKQYPKKEFEYEFCNEMEGKKLLENNYIDIFICLSCVLEGCNNVYRYCRLKESPLSFIVSNTHKLALKEELFFSDIETEIFLITHTNYDTSPLKAIIRNCYGRELDKKRVKSYNNMNSMEIALKAGKGIFVGFEEQFRNSDHKLIKIPIKICKKFEKVYVIGAWKKSKECKIADVLPALKI